MRALLLVLATSVALSAQTAETALFRAVMLPSNEVPPVEIAASGAATIRVHYFRDASGQVQNSSVDFNITYNFPAAPITFTGLHIHRGAAGANGPVRIDTGISAANNVATEGGRGTIARQAQVTGENGESLSALRDLLTNPSGFYVNLHSTTNPGGVIRGQLQRAEEVVLFGSMSPANEVPPIPGLNASGLGLIHAIRSFDQNGAVASGLVNFDVSYTGFAGATFTGLHIHRGVAGVNGPVIIDTGISRTAPVTADASGAGSVAFPVEVDVADPNELETLNGLFFNPAGYYVNLHTTVNPGGAIRAQLRATDRMRFPVTMSPANEVPPITNLEAQGIGFVDVMSVRGVSGAIEAARVTFDVNHRFPGRTEFNGFHIHNGVAGVNGGVTVNTGLSAANPVVSETGFGNITRSVTVTGGAALETLNSMLTTPENHYVNLHTSVHPGGAVRAQAGAPAAGAPAINAIVSAVLEPQTTTLAPNGLFTIFGTNLARFASSASATSTGVVPTMLNGVSVQVSGRAVPLLYAAPGQINAVLPADLAPGSHAVVVFMGTTPSAGRQITVVESAPAVFAVLKNSDFSMVSAGNAAAAGDILVVYATGLGQTTPAQETGRPAALSPLANTAPVTVTIGGTNAEVLYSIASPGFLGLNQVAVRVPAGVAAGTAPLVLRQGTAEARPVNVVMR